MGRATAGVLIQHIRRVVLGQQPEPGSDSELLQRYSQQRDEAAFATLVQRHGPMVWNACRRALGHHQDAEDVFQATFLVLARKAAAGRWRNSIAPWLYAVAQRLACKARCQAAHRPTLTSVEPVAPDPFEAMTARELLTVLDGEVAALPERYRGPVVLCWLEGRTQPEAARQLGTSLNTLRRCLERGRQLLQARLTRRGLAPAGVLLVPALALAIPATTLAGALRTTAATPRALALAETLLAAATGKVQAVLALFLLACVALAGAGLAAYTPSKDPPAVVQPKDPPPQDAGKQAERVDALGDPLPPGALFRLGTMRLRHGATLFTVAFSPTENLIASGGRDRTIRLWDTATGKEVRSIAGLQKGVRALAFSPDGKWLAGAGDEDVIGLWEVATGKEVRRLPCPQGQVRALAFSPKGDRLVAGAQEVHLWDVADGKLVKSWKTDEDSVAAVAFSPKGEMIAAAGRLVHVWETASGKGLYIGQMLDEIGTVLFAGNGSTLLMIGPAETRVWDIAGNKKVDVLGGAKGRGDCAALAPDGKWLAIGNREGVIRVWDWAADKEVLQLRRLPDHVRCLAFSRDGKTLAALADAGAIHLWDTATGKAKVALPGHEERLSSVACTPDGHTVVTAAWDGTVRLWDAKTAKEIRRFEVDLNKEKNDVRDPAAIRSVAVSPDGKLVAAVRGDDKVVIWDAATGTEVHGFAGSSVAFAPDGKLIACGCRGTEINDANTGIIRLYDRATGKVVRELRGHLTVIASLTFTPDSKTLLSRGVVLEGLLSGDPGENETKFVRVWDVATGKERKSFPAGNRIHGLVLAPDGRTVAYLLENAVALVETATGGQRGELHGHTEMVFDAAFSPDGRILASAGMDGTVRLWDLFSGQEIGKLQGHRGWVLSVAFSPDGAKLVSGSIDTTALIWDASRFTQRSKSTPLTAKDLESCWTDLAGDAAVSYRAVGRLLGSPKEAVAMLGERLKPSPSAPADRINRLVGDLDSKEFKTRDQAMKELEKLGAVAVPALQKALTAKVSLEMRQRLELLLDKVQGGNPAPELARQLRAVEVLEGIGTAEARKVLEGLVAAGAPEGRLTQEAEAALRRWQRP